MVILREGTGNKTTPDLNDPTLLAPTGNRKVGLCLFRRLSPAFCFALLHRSPSAQKISDGNYVQCDARMEILLGFKHISLKVPGVFHVTPAPLPEGLGVLCVMTEITWAGGEGLRGGRGPERFL